ncbi:MAG: hypothetical protein QNJ81_02780 [Acidimicrobiia bacterium]|nr:hypothetical protein [Acidimicrobiia bacterium]
MAEALIIIGIAINAAFWIVILVNVARGRHSMETRTLIKWAIILLLIPGLGVLGLYLERSDRYGLFLVVLLVAVAILGLVILARDRDSMQTREVVKWALLIVLLPGLGVLGFFFWRLENAIHRGTPGRRDRAAPFLRKPTSRDR